jgi:shikimate kinase
MKRTLVLIGLPGAGTSTVGPLVAAKLGLPYVDLDLEIAAAAGRSIPELFAAEGEDAFRVLERDAMLTVLSAPPAVVAPGGGWAAHPGNLEAVQDQVTTVYLALSAAAAAERLRDGGDRPLLAGGDLRARLKSLLEARDRWYLRATHVVAAEPGLPGDVADRVVEAVQLTAGREIPS